MFLLGNNLKPVTPMHLERTRMIGSMKKFEQRSHGTHDGTGRIHRSSVVLLRAPIPDLAYYFFQFTHRD